MSVPLVNGSVKDFGHTQWLPVPVLYKITNSLTKRLELTLLGCMLPMHRTSINMMLEFCMQPTLNSPALQSHSSKLCRHTVDITLKDAVQSVY